MLELDFNELVSHLQAEAAAQTREAGLSRGIPVLLETVREICRSGNPFLLLMYEVNTGAIQVVSDVTPSEGFTRICLEFTALMRERAAAGGASDNQELTAETGAMTKDELIKRAGAQGCEVVREGDRLRLRKGRVLVDCWHNGRIQRADVPFELARTLTPDEAAKALGLA